MWTIELYENSNGEYPVGTHLKSITSMKLKTKILRDIELLKEFGNRLGMPYTRSIIDKRGNMFELRTI